MIFIVQLIGYIALILAVGGIVAGIEALNRHCPDGAAQRPKPVAIPVGDRHARLRRNKP